MKGNMLRVEICSNCHPFFTGKQKLLDTAGRIERFNRKYGGKLLPLLESSGGSVFRIEPKVAFGQDEHADDFVQAATRWTF